MKKYSIIFLMIAGCLFCPAEDYSHNVFSVADKREFRVACLAGELFTVRLPVKTYAFEIFDVLDVQFKERNFTDFIGSQVVLGVDKLDRYENKTIDLSTCSRIDVIQVKSEDSVLSDEVRQKHFQKRAAEILKIFKEHIQPSANYQYSERNFGLSVRRTAPCGLPNHESFFEVGELSFYLNLPDPTKAENHDRYSQMLYTLPKISVLGCELNIAHHRSSTVLRVSEYDAGQEQILRHINRFNFVYTKKYPTVVCGIHYPLSQNFYIYIPCQRTKEPDDKLAFLETILFDSMKNIHIYYGYQWLFYSEFVCPGILIFGYEGDLSPARQLTWIFSKII